MRVPRVSRRWAMRAASACLSASGVAPTGRTRSAASAATTAAAVAACRRRPGLTCTPTPPAGRMPPLTCGPQYPGTLRDWVMPGATSRCLRGDVQRGAQRQQPGQLGDARVAHADAPVAHPLAEEPGLVG